MYSKVSNRPTPMCDIVQVHPSPMIRCISYVIGGEQFETRPPKIFQIK